MPVGALLIIKHLSYPNGGGRGEGGGRGGGHGILTFPARSPEGAGKEKNILQQHGGLEILFKEKN